MSFPIIDVKKTGENIKEIMKIKEVSVTSIAGFLGISEKSSVYKWFRGESLPSLDNMFAISKILGVPMENIIVTK